jgi:hypothetical protein
MSICQVLGRRKESPCLKLFRLYLLVEPYCTTTKIRTSLQSVLSISQFTRLGLTPHAGGGGSSFLLRTMIVEHSFEQN